MLTMFRPVVMGRNCEHIVGSSDLDFAILCPYFVIWWRIFCSHLSQQLLSFDGEIFMDEDACGLEL